MLIEAVQMSVNYWVRLSARTVDVISPPQNRACIRAASYYMSGNPEHIIPELYSISG